MANANSKRCAFYLRASTKEQSESHGAQRDVCTRCAADHNWEIVPEYLEPATSGDSFNRRPVLQQMLVDAKAGLFDVLLVRQLSRLSRRDSFRSVAIVQPLVDAGVVLYSVTEGEFDLTDPMGRMKLSWMAEQAHTENRSRSYNIANGQERCAQKGSWQGAPPYAYKIEGEKHNKRLLLVDATKVEQDNVLRMFTMYDEGETAVSIAQILNNEGHPSPFGKLWRTNTIYAILNNPVYVGDHRFNYKSRGKYYETKGGKPVERSGHWADSDQEKARSTINDPDDWITHHDHWPSIVSRELWDRVQRRRKNNVLCRPKKSAAPYRFAGLLRCGCGAKRPMHGKSKKRSSRAKKRKYQCLECKSWVDEGEMLNAVASAVMDKLAPAYLDELRQGFARKLKQPPRRKTSVKSLEQQLEKQNRKLVILDADMLVPVQAEIRRLQGDIALAKREKQQRRQSDPDRLVEQAIEKLKKLPAVLKNGNDQQVKAFLQTAFPQVKVWTDKTGSGHKTRYELVRGEIHLASPTEQDLSR